MGSMKDTSSNIKFLQKRVADEQWSKPGLLKSKPKIQFVPKMTSAII